MKEKQLLTQYIDGEPISITLGQSPVLPIRGSLPTVIPAVFNFLRSGCTPVQLYLMKETEDLALLSYKSFERAIKRLSREHETVRIQRDFPVYTITMETQSLRNPSP